MSCAVAPINVIPASVAKFKSASRRRRRATGWSALHACYAAPLGCGPSSLGVACPLLCAAHVGVPWHSQRHVRNFAWSIPTSARFLPCFGRCASLLVAVGMFLCMRSQLCWFMHLAVEACLPRSFATWQWKLVFRGHTPRMSHALLPIASNLVFSL